MTTGDHRHDDDGGSVVKSFCRTCTNGCGVLVQLSRSGRASSLVGDPDNPVFHGYTCTKGRAQPAMAASGDRLLMSQKRRPDGTFTPIPIADAISEIALRLQVIVDEHGPGAVAGYQGTSAHTSAAAPTIAQGFLAALGSRLTFTTNTIDKGGRNVAQALHGSWQAPRQAWDRPDVALLFGINPLVSYQGFPSGAPARWLIENQQRGMQLIVIDPRETDIARKADLHVQARPGTDIYILAAIIRTILAEDLYDQTFVQQHTAGLDLLREAVQPFTTALAARVADVPESQLLWTAHTFAGAGRGFAVGGTGPQMTTDGVLIEYLLLCLESLCGHYLREGETVRNAGSLLSTYCSAKAQASPPRSAFPNDRTFRVRGLRETVAGPPTAALPDEILMDGPGQLRALISLSGNPAAAIPGKQKVVEALRKLDLLVQIDPWMSETAQLADYVIAPTVWLEAEGITLVQDYITTMAPGYGLADSYAQYSPAVARRPEGSDLIEEWDFFYRLACEMNLQLTLEGRMIGNVAPILVDMDGDLQVGDILRMLTQGGRIPLEQIKQNDGGTLYPEPPVTVAAADPGWLGRLDFANAEMLTQLARHAEPPADTDQRYPYRLVPRRAQHVHNSSCNVPQTNRGRSYNPAYLSPSDLEDLGISPGELIELSSPEGSIVAVAEPDVGLRQGVVSMTHCYGAVDVSAERDDPLAHGSGTNWLTSNEARFDPYTGQPLMSNVPIAVARSADR